MKQRAIASLRHNSIKGVKRYEGEVRDLNTGSAKEDIEKIPGVKELLKEGWFYTEEPMYTTYFLVYNEKGDLVCNNPAMVLTKVA